MPVLEYCSAVWCSNADTHYRLLDRVVSGASFLTGGVFECDLAHCRSVAVLCILYQIRCNPMHPLYGPLNDVSEWFPVNVGLRQCCVKSPWLFNVYMDGVVREVNVRVLVKWLELLSANGGGLR